MTAVEKAASVYEREVCARSFREDLEAHLWNGYVFSAPGVFLMGRGVRHDAVPEWLADPWVVFPEAEQDCWMIYLAALGEGGVREGLEAFWRLEPRRLPYVAWERRNKLRIFRREMVCF